MMLIAMLISLALISSSTDAAENPYVATTSKEERKTRIDALTLAYDAMEKAHLNSKGKTISIKEVGGFTVVSFLNRDGETIYGGQAHLTYDPKLGKIINIEAED